ncbi:MAG: hypothetical protein ACYS7M_16135 [Planctomycetota bacterium]|jgi:hypothetical protein
MSSKSNPRQQSTSFNTEQIEATVKLFRLLDTIPQLRHVVSHRDLVAVRRKFLGMHDKQRQKSQTSMN